MLLITQFFLSRTLRKLAEQALTAVKTPSWINKL